MKTIAKPIEVISYTDNKGKLRPLKFRIESEDETERIIKIDKIILMEKEKLAGNNMLKFRCQSIINNIEMVFEIKYELNTCRWILFKI